MAKIPPKKATKKTENKLAKTKTARKWSRPVMQRSNALYLEHGVFAFNDPKKIARSLKKSAEASIRKKGTSYQSAMPC